VERFRFDSDVGQRIETFGSANFVLSHILKITSESYVHCVHLGPQGKIGRHQTPARQLFLVVQGAGLVCGEGMDCLPVRLGDAVLWEKDEQHEASTDSGLVAIIIEGETLDPAARMVSAR